VHNNLANMVTNTKAAIGRIMDVDYAAESANMVSAQMLLQASTAMLKQSQSMQKMILSLLQP
jgi:flagellin